MLRDHYQISLGSGLVILFQSGDGSIGVVTILFHYFTEPKEKGRDVKISKISLNVGPGHTSVRPGRADRFLAPKREGERDLVSPGIVAAGCRRPDGLGEGGKGKAGGDPSLE